jgi:hypothetical protein
MKRCATCKQYKDESEFNWRWKSLGILQPSCRNCQKEHRRTWYESHKDQHLENVYERKKKVIQDSKEYVWNFLSTHPCVDCGESDPMVLEFDHISGSKKSNISVMAGQGYSLTAIQREIEKCVVRCANCHRRKTSKERGWFSG